MGHPVYAEGSAVATTSAVTPELLESKIKETEANNSLEEAAKANLLKHYRKSLSEIEAVRNFEGAVKKYTEAQQQVLKETEALRSALGKPLPKVTKALLGVKKEIDLNQMEQLLLKLQTARSGLQSKMAETDALLEQQVIRPTQIHQRLAEAKRELDDIAKAMAAPPLAGQSHAVAEARVWSLSLTRNRLDAEIRSLDQEILTQPGRMDLLRLQRDAMARELDVSTQQIALLHELIGDFRQAEASQAKAEATAAQKDVEGKHPLLLTIADENAQLTQASLASTETLKQINVRLEERQSQFKLLEAEFKSTKQKMEMAGLSSALGGVLMTQRRRLEAMKREKGRSVDREETTVSVSLRQIDYNEIRKQLSDLAAAVDRRLAEIRKETKPQLRHETEKLLRNQRELLDKAIALDANLLQRLVELDFAERQLLELISTYDAFLAENLVWIPSVSMVGLPMAAQLPDELSRLLLPVNISVLGQVLTASILHKPILSIGLILLLLSQLFVPGLRRKGMQTGEWVNDLVRDRFSHTLKALMFAVFRAVSWSLLFALVGWQLGSESTGNDFVRETASFLLLAAPVLFILRLFWILCEPKGIAEKHFGWGVPAAKLLRRQTLLLMLTLLPAAYVVMVTSVHTVGSTHLGLSRLAFVFMMLSLSYYFYRLYRSRSEVIAYLGRSYPQGSLLRTRRLWFPLAVAVPITLALLALSGYFYTAGVLTRSLVNSLLLILAIVVVYEVVIRWLLVRLKIARRVAAAARIDDRSQESVGGKAEADEGLPHVDEPRLDLAAIDSDTRKLITILVQLALLVGLWVIWSAVFPAFAGLDDIALWQQAVTMGGEQQLRSITVQHVATAIIVAVVTAVVARSLPSLLNIVMMRQLEVKQGTRYAYETLTRYLVIGIGLVVIFSSMGGNWSEIQWLVAALGVGIGFGLQEIVANFISGLIILFERPIRVGDIVTVGDVSGVVSKIRIRATTITNWDRQELLVPNKEFITGRLLNWSLSDTIIRSSINIGIAYGSDVDKALALLEEAAVEQERVLDDPAPLITFDNFGDNTLNLKMQFFLPNIDQRMKILSEINQTINRKFNAAGIEFAFPQRDIHLDTARPLEIRLTGNTGPAG